MGDAPTPSIEAGRASQLAARRASLHALLNVLAILTVDAWALGRLYRAQHATEASVLGFDMPASTMQLLALAILGLSLSFKVQFSLKTFRFAKQAARATDPRSETADRRHARGARITTVVCGLVSAAVLVVAYLLAN